MAEALSELVPHDSLVLYRTDPPLRLLRPVLVHDPLYESQIWAAGGIPYGRGITGTAAESRIPQLVNDVHLDPRSMQVPDTPEDDPESLVAIPLLARDELKGVMCMYRLGEDNHFTVGEFKLAIVFGELAALAIDNAEIRTRLETEVITDHLTAMFNHRYFHERLGEEIRRANRQRSRVGLVIYDIDDFKRVNDTYGHLVGDQVLQGVAAVSRETCRTEDVICRIGGEEFAVILPGSDLTEALSLAERLREGINSVSYSNVGRITVSVGVAEGPMHASSPRELITCADLALLQAKASGKNQVLVYSEVGIDRTLVGARATPDGEENLGQGPRARGPLARLASLTSRGEPRSVAQLRMLQSLSARLNRLNDVRQIGEAITAELRSLIDYHHCWVFVLHADGETLVPIAFRGDLPDYEGDAFNALLTKVGEGFTGHVARSRQASYAPDANQDPHATTIPGTEDIDESMLGAPMLFGDRLVGVVVLSKLGIDQFDNEDLRLLEALAASAAVAFENARLLQVEHQAAELAGALLQLSQAMTKIRDTSSVLSEAVGAVRAMLRRRRVSAWIRDPKTGSFRLVEEVGMQPEEPYRLAGRSLPQEIDRRLLASKSEEPFVVSGRISADSHDGEAPVTETLVAPIPWEPDGLGAIVVGAPEGEAVFSEEDLRLARGIADITSLALGNAGRFDELEKAYVSTVEALASALEAQDEYTSDHARALAELALSVGAELGFEGDALKTLELAALFHDIGKIGIPSEIIRKAGPLTASERRTMDLHPAIGEEILAPVPFLQPIRPIVRACHERWDGHGYPDGLAGESIPLEARIVFVCDAFHAMTSDRPYRAALPDKEAIRRLKLASGTQFDPAIVETFVRLHEAGGIQIHEHSPRHPNRS